ncbi:MAG TPA: alpha/beta hydrolase, partial [Acidimicrobiales bacterium]|nr:alpha/beta hydrolase [Acidimicrobiales bacterium]
MLVPSTNGVTLRVHDLGGDDAAPPLLLCHATGFHGQVWSPLAAILREKYRVWSLDFRGHGDSTLPTDGRGLQWEGFGDDVLSAIDALELDRPFAVGHSKGGAALLLAEQARTGVLRAIYAFEPIVFPPMEVPQGDDQSNPLAAGARKRREVFDSKDDAYANFSSKPPLSTLHPDALRAYVDHGFADEPDGTVRLKCRPESEAQVYEMGRTHGAWSRLGEVWCPVVVAAGSTTTSVTPELARMQVEQLP